MVMHEVYNTSILSFFIEIPEFMNENFDPAVALNVIMHFAPTAI